MPAHVGRMEKHRYASLWSRMRKRDWTHDTQSCHVERKPTFDQIIGRVHSGSPFARRFARRPRMFATHPCMPWGT